MSPAAIQLVIMLIEEAIKEAPIVATELQTLFAKKAITADDWAALRMRVVAKTYEDYVPDTAIPKA